MTNSTPVNVASAKADRYTDDEIAQENTRRGFPPGGVPSTSGTSATPSAAPQPVNVASAKADGYTDDEIAQENTRRGVGSAPFNPDAYVASHRNNALMASFGPVGQIAAFMSAKPEPVQPGTTPSLLQTIKDNLAAGSSYGFGAKAGAAIDAASSGNGMSGYDANIASRRAALATEAAANPKTALAANLAGTIASPLSWLPGVAGGAGVEGSGLLANLARAARGGAVMGGVQALGNNDSSNLADKAKAVGLGVGGGALAGGIGGAIGHGVGSLLGKSTAADRAIALNPTEFTDATNALDSHIAAGNGDNVMAADLLPKLAAAATKAASTSPKAYAALTAPVEARSGQQLARISSAARDAMGDNPVASDVISHLTASKNSWAADAYGALRDANPAIPSGGDLADVLKRPGMQSAFDQAKLSDNLEGTPQGQRIISMFTGRVDPATSLGLTSMPEIGSMTPVSYQSVAQLERMLSGKASVAGRAGDVPLSDAYKALQNGVNDHLDRYVPQHAVLDQQYATRSAAIRAVDQGASDGANGDADVIRNTVARMKDPSVLAGYRTGMASWIRSHLNTKGTSADVAKEFIGGNANTQAKLEAAFGDQATFDRFMRTMNSENAMTQLKLPATAPEARPGINAKDFLGMQHGTMGNIASGGLGLYGIERMINHPVEGAAIIAARGIASAALRAVQQRTQTAVGRSLATQTPDALRALLSRIGPENAARMAAQRAIARRVGAAGSAGLINLGFGPNTTPGEVR